MLIAVLIESYICVL